MKSPLSILVLLLLVTTAATQETRTVRLGWPSAPSGVPDPVVYGAPPFRWLVPEWEERDLEAPRVRFSARPMDEGTVDAILGDEVRSLGGTVEIEDEGLRVNGSPAAIARAELRWHALTRFLDGRAVVRVTLLETPPDFAPKTSDPDDLAEALRSSKAPVVWAGRFVTRRGVPATRESLTVRSYVLDHDVEVAQSAAIVEPNAGTVTTGRRVSVVCRPVSAREAAVCLSLHLSGSPPQVETVKLPGTSVDLPTARFLSLFTEMRLGLGRPLAGLVPHPLRAGHLAVVVTVEALPSDDGRPAGLVDLVAVVGQPDARLPAIDPYEDNDWGDERGKAFFLRASALEDRGLEISEISHSVILLRGEAADVEQAEGSFGPATAVLGRASRSLPWAELVRHPEFDAWTGRFTTTGAAALGTQSRTLMPLRGGTPLLLMHGTWRRTIVNLNVEIAEAAAIVDPIVTGRVDGETLVVRRAPTGLVLNRRTSTVRSVGRRDHSVFKDVARRRGMESGHLLDTLVGAETRARLEADRAGLVDVRREGDAAVVEVIEVK